MDKNRPIRIVLSGPESVGKSTLGKKLAEILDGKFVPEYAREYVEKLHRPYEFKDVESIARKQIEELSMFTDENFVIHDTSLIITKVWFDVQYNQIPSWFEEEFERFEVDLILLLKDDLPWVEDPTRENGGEMRSKLFHRYQEEYQKLKLPIIVISGDGDERINKAMSAITKHIERKG